jgi:hypothetical protein
MGKEQLQSDAVMGVESDDDDSPGCRNNQDGCSLDLSDRSVLSTSPEVEINFVKAVSLSSLIHPTHEPYSQSTYSQSDAMPSHSLLSLIGAQSSLMEACDEFGVSIHEFQHL